MKKMKRCLLLTTAMVLLMSAFMVINVYGESKSSWMQIGDPVYSPLVEESISISVDNNIPKVHNAV